MDSRSSDYHLLDILSRRKSFCGDFDFFQHIPNLSDFHKEAYKRFLDKDTPHNKRENRGLEKVFNTFFPIYHAKSKIKIEYLGYELQEPRYSIQDCILRNISYTSTLRVLIRITNEQVKQAQEIWVMAGEVPLMLEKGTFIVSGHEKIFIAKAQRCPGVLFMKEYDVAHDKTFYLAKLYPNVGAWLHMKVEKDVINVSINKKKKFALTTLLLCFPKKAMPNDELDEEYDIKEILDGFNPSIEIVRSKEFWKVPFDAKKYKKTPVPFNIYVNNKLVIPAQSVVETELKLPAIVDVPHDDIVGSFIAEDIYDSKTGEIFVEVGSRISLENLEDLKDCKKLKLYLVNDDYSPIVLNSLQVDKITTRSRALFVWAQSIKMGTHYGAYGLGKIFNIRFFDSRYYDLEYYGRYKLNQSLGLNKTEHYVTFDDLVATTKQLILFANGLRQEDEIDSLSNKRIRLVDEIVENFFRLGVIKLEKSLKDKLHTFDFSKSKVADVLNFRILMYSVVEGFYKFSHMYDDNNGFSGLVQSRKIVYSGASKTGASKERVYGSLRDVNISKFGRICSVQTPEGKKTGLLEHLALYSQPNEYGFLCTLYHPVTNGIVDLDKIVKVSPRDEVGKVIVSKDQYEKKIVGKKEVFTHKEDYLIGHKDGETGFFYFDTVDYVFIAQNQIFSVACSSITFPGHCDPYRVLSGANMGSQAVPIIKDEAPFIGSGMEGYFAEKILAKNSGKVIKVDCKRIVIEAFDDDSIIDVYKLVLYKKTNTDTCIVQKALVDVGDEVKAGDLIADGFTARNGELSLGKNLLVVYQSNPWCYEDAFVLSDRLVHEDELTSINLEVHECQVLESRFGPEQCTRDVPGVNEEFLTKLDECGIINVGTEVRGGDIVVGKITPTGGVGHVAPEQKLLRMIFGEKMFECSDSSLKLPHGTDGTIVKIQTITRKGIEKDDQTILQEKLALEELEKEYQDKFDIIESAFRKKISILLKDESMKDLGITQIDRKIEELSDKKQKTEARKLFNNMKNMMDNSKKERDKSIKNFSTGVELPEGVIKLIRIHIACKKVIEPGDKLCGRYGNKGVISNIMPRCDMPHLADGTPADIIINPLGLLARMNLGQVFETSIGYAIYELRRKIGSTLRAINHEKTAKKRTEMINDLRKMIVLALGDRPVNFHGKIADSDEDIIFIAQKVYEDGIRLKFEQFSKFTNDDLTQILQEFGADTEGKVTMYDGKTGEPFKSKLLVGYQFILKLCHMVSLKLHARSVGPYSLINLQPLGGRARFGGQRFGEMEVWALEGYGAAFNCNELLTIKSDDLVGRRDVFSQLVKNKTYSLVLMNAARNKKVSEGFKLLVFELRAAGFDLSLVDNQGNSILNF